MKAAEREFVLIGVAHTDERNTEEILQRVDSSVRHVYHERSEDATVRSWLKWAAYSPTVAISTVLRSASDSEFASECERAAHELAGQQGLEDVSEIGMRYSERTQAKPKSETLAEWGYIFSIPSFGLLLLSESTFFGLIFFVWSLPIPLLFGGLMNRQEFSRREEAMVENILCTTPERQEGKEIIIVGEDHLSGVGGWLQSRGFSVEPIWLNTILQSQSSN